MRDRGVWYRCEEGGKDGANTICIHTYTIYTYLHVLLQLRLKRVSTNIVLPTHQAFPEASSARWLRNVQWKNAWM